MGLPVRLPALIVALPVTLITARHIAFVMPPGLIDLGQLSRILGVRPAEGRVMGLMAGPLDLIAVRQEAPWFVRLRATVQMLVAHQRYVQGMGPDFAWSAHAAADGTVALNAVSMVSSDRTG